MPSNASARGDGEIDVEPPLEDDAAELDGENSCSASLVAPSFELTDEPTSPKMGPWGDKGESGSSAAAASIAPGVSFR